MYRVVDEVDISQYSEEYCYAALLLRRVQRLFGMRLQSLWRSPSVLHCQRCMQSVELISLVVEIVDVEATDAGFPVWLTVIDDICNVCSKYI